MEPLGVLSIIGFIGTVAGFAELGFRGNHVAKKMREQLMRQQSEADVIRLVLQEAIRGSSLYGAPTDAMDRTMLLCAKLSKRLDSELQHVEGCLDQRGWRRLRGLGKAMTRTNERRYAYEAFRDAVLLLRELGDSCNTGRQLSSMMADLSDVRVESEIDEDSDSIQKWDPGEYQERTGLNLDDLTLSNPNLDSDRPLLKTLAASNYTFDARISLVKGSQISYIPVRGLWDTGSDAFFISKTILDRANIGEEDMTRLEETHTYHGIGSASFSPAFSIDLTWHIRRNMNSRRDTFYVTEEEIFDILVPYTLSIGVRSTTIGKEGRNALILQLRPKKKAHKKQELEKEEHNNVAAESARKVKEEKLRKERRRIIEERERAAALNASQGNTQSITQLSALPSTPSSAPNNAQNNTQTHTSPNSPTTA
ncbi:uncharacterized protein BDR25DRAFT_36005 [Lindgomyces ingoldianus]|uniref:Uncharacterized protein n=1 Tax=Lindgomyces ingoldianus TaxID=673940 RepID=A0ACB6QSV4_9PLEO|nr:uncharacterized protein BDR25DRAFT_36005 [Lindgomyces ingoldianus]KAF2470011.1 hypothetical protein BDR25DRAFT_36005 [Lindgomyces ingoldianus]